MKYCTLLLVCILLPFSTYGAPKFPITLSPKNTTINFSVGSTWHTVRGITKEFDGNVSLKRPQDPASLTVTLTIPVLALDTDYPSRDTRMREVLHNEAHPKIEALLTSKDASCNFLQLNTGSSCYLPIIGTLTISGNQKEISLSAHIARDRDDRLFIEGSYTLQWAEYGVDDPSIIIARLEPEVTITFTVEVPYDTHS